MKRQRANLAQKIGTFAMIRNFEDWAFGMTFVIALGVAASMDGPKHGIDRIASIRPAANIEAIAPSPLGAKITVSAKRLPKECKGLTSASSAELRANCAAFLNQDATMTATGPGLSLAN
jgi:hypothetical protein